MSWITPIKNTFIKFIVKGNGSGGGSGGIDEETLNAKLAQFYATTETKILNLVNQKLASYVLQPAFNELEAKVNTNTTNIATNTTNISTNTTDINTLKQKVENLEATPIGGSSLEFVSLKIPYSLLSESSIYEDWNSLWNEKTVSLPLYSIPNNALIPTLASYLENKTIVSIINAYFDTGDTLSSNTFIQKDILYAKSPLKINMCIFNGVITFGSYTQSKPYTPKDSDYLYISLIVANKPKKLTESSENGVTIEKGGV